MAILIDQISVSLDSSAFTLDGASAGVVTPDLNPVLLSLNRPSLLTIDRSSFASLHRPSLIVVER